MKNRDLIYSAAAVIIISSIVFYAFEVENMGMKDLCTSTGGTIVQTKCCASVADFPDTCLIGACGCSPANSHDVLSCDCGDKCFSPESGCS